MNYKRLALGGGNVVGALLALVIAVLFGLLSALPLVISGLSASGEPISTTVRFANVLVVVGTVGLALACVVAAGGWFTDAVSRRVQRRASIAGIALAVLGSVGTGLMSGTLLGVLVMGAMLGIPAIALVTNLFVFRSSTGDDVPTVEDEPVRPSV
ncbi:hypothetical protein [Halogeometricum limi]|uniref:Uncharacterized protein n=1 Tax=Halogeometricum limi TaxID=555875 RepID=A0A1I6HLV7_9EURY|nr:hypothetical protein [Halogeometricum limi]SFR55463.1 hypothetical protein SAMN04488124_2384 [Halogeometricum limi]